VVVAGASVLAAVAVVAAVDDPPPAHAETIDTQNTNAIKIANALFIESPPR